MNKRTHRPPVFTLLLSLFLSLVTGNTAAAQHYKVIILETMAVPVILEHSRAVLDHLQHSNLAAQNDLEIVLLKAEGSYRHGREALKAELERSPTDCVVTLATLASKAAKELLEGTSTPMVFGAVSDPVGAGLIKEVGKPTGSNITGLVHSIHRETQLSFMRRIWGDSSPLPITLGIVQSDYTSTMDNLHKFEKLAAASGDFVILYQMVPYRDMPENLDVMLQGVVTGVRELEEQVDLWWQLAGALAETPKLTETVLGNSRKPIGYGNTMDSVRLGALFTITPDFEASGREIANQVIAILEGESAGNIPPDIPQNFQVGINLTTALKHGLLIPPDILNLAGKSVFH